MPTILIKKSDTPGSVPGTANLTNLAGGAEVAVNTADRRMYSMNSSSAVVELGVNPSSLTCADGSFTLIKAASASITNLTATSLVLSNLSIASANITTLTGTTFGTTATTQLRGASGQITQFNSTSGTITTINSTSATITGLNSTSANITTLTGTTFGTTATTQIRGASGQITQFNSTSGTITTINSTSATITGLNSTSANITTLTGTTFGTTATTQLRGASGQITQLNSTSATITTFSSSSATATNLLATTLTVSGIGIFPAGTATIAAITTTGDTNTGIFFPAADTIAFTEGGVESMRLDASGNLGLGVTPSAWSGTAKALQVSNAGIEGRTDNASYATLSANGYTDSGTWKYISSDFASRYTQFQGQHLWLTAASGTAGNAITFTTAMVLNASGNLGVGTTSPGSILELKRDSSSGSALNYPNIRLDNGNASGYAGLYFLDDGTQKAGIEMKNDVGALQFYTGTTERARITSGGEFIGGKTTAGVDTNGWELGPSGVVGVSRQADIPMYVNRNGDDGILVSLRQDGVGEGSISVSGSTVSYNAFAGSHWSQLQDGSKPDILRGTVMESINELCVWPDENNERLPKSKISDTAGSKKVYGVFMAWDNDWTDTNDMYVTAVGAFICRVNGSVTVQEGDLLESNGDGTARVQADDIIRSSTIGKVTSTVKTHQYDDGSYCVPTVLYCG